MGMTKIRHASIADSQAIVHLLGQLGRPSTIEEVLKKLEKFSGNERVAVFVAEVEGNVVGLVTAHILTVINRPRDVAWITALVVDDKARNKGVGRALVKTVEAYARRAGCERLSVTTYEHLKGAQEFYVKLGIAPTGLRFGKML